jgi:hypothetical protein
MKHIYVFLLSSLMLVQCKNRTEDVDSSLGPIKSNFVSSYARLDSLGFNEVYDNGAVKGANTSVKNIRLEIVYQAKEVFRCNDSDTLNRNKFKTYARLYKDTSFNKPAALSFNGEPCMIDTISKIEILCNRSYDDSHPVGVSLNDVVKILYCCAADYINNHYSAQHDSLISLKTLTLQEFNKNRNYLVGIGASSLLSFLISPKESGEYIFTVKFCLENGKVFIHQFKPISLEGKM